MTFVINVKLKVVLFSMSIIFLSNANEECKRNFSIRKNAIILTKSSQSKGAIFIHKQTVSRFPECYALCCSNPDCTVAVYENKVNHICFLFNCKQPNVCTFTEHAHYISMMYLNSENEHNKYDKAKSDIIKPSVDGKLGEICGTLRKCGPDNSMCTSGTCICQLGFLGRNGECVRSMCPKPELMFQCFDLTKMPFCVAIYDQCNGLFECGDGSDEINCDNKKSMKSIISNKTSNERVPIKHRDKMSNERIDSLSNHEIKHPKEHINNPDHILSDSNNISQSVPRYHKSSGLHRTNPLVENQLLVLESKNSLPKYSHSNQQTENVHRPFTKSQRDSGSNNNQGYESRRYAKLKTSSYPHLTKIDEYYQKPVSESSENSNKWNNPDTYYSDYDYPQISINNRDQGSDWYGDKSSNPYSDSTYSDSVGKYLNDRNSYSDYTDNDDDFYTKPRGRYVSDTDYNSKNRLHKGYELSMDRSNSRNKDSEKIHKIFIKPKANQVENHVTSTSSSDKVDLNLDNINIDNINAQEWSTAVIMLSFGLLIAAAMLIAIGIKMRSWRRRLRKGKKGKSLTTDEGDYLINGMYL